MSKEAYLVPSIMPDAETQDDPQEALPLEQCSGVGVPGMRVLETPKTQNTSERPGPFFAGFLLTKG